MLFPGYGMYTNTLCARPLSRRKRGIGRAFGHDAKKEMLPTQQSSM